MIKLGQSEAIYMTRKQRIEYLVVTLCVLFTGFLIYGLVGSIQPLINDDNIIKEKPIADIE